MNYNLGVIESRLYEINSKLTDWSEEKLSNHGFATYLVRAVQDMQTHLDRELVAQGEVQRPTSPEPK
jgi:hypothetical protein